MKKFKLYQVKDDKTRDYGFMGLDMMVSLGIQVDLDNYDLVYEGTHDSEAQSLLGIQEELFRKFNLEHPEDFKGRSMSVSDILEIDGEHYFCDSFGWNKVTLLKSL